MTPSRKGRWYGWLAVAWVAAIYSTLYVARPAAEFLRERDLLRLTVWAVLALLGVAVLAWAVRRRFRPPQFAVLAIAAAAYLYAIRSVSPVEVKLHFAQYGVLGGLLYQAFRAGGGRLAPIWAVLVTAACGWLDEGIQYLLPNRFYDLMDVVINALAGAMAVTMLWSLDRLGNSEEPTA